MTDQNEPAPNVTISVEHFAYLMTFARVGADSLTGAARHLRNRHLDTIEKEAKAISETSGSAMFRYEVGLTNDAAAGYEDPAVKERVRAALSTFGVSGFTDTGVGFDFLVPRSADQAGTHRAILAEVLAATGGRDGDMLVNLRTVRDLEGDEG